MVTAMKTKPKAKAKASAKPSQGTVVTGKRMDLVDLERKYKKIKFVKNSLRMDTNPKSHTFNKQVVDVVCVDNKNKRRTLATSDLQHYKEGALTEEGARQRRLERIRERRRLAK